MNVRVYKTLAIVLLSGVTGCGSFHRKTPPPPALQPQPQPTLSQTPLYSPEMSENNPRTPALPAEAAAIVVKEPEPPPKKVRKPHKPKPAPAAPKVADTDLASAATAAPGGSVAATGVVASAANPPVERDRRTAETQQAKAALPAASPIGELTTGDSAEVAQTSRETFDLIRTTRDGTDSIRRSLSADEKKTIAEINTFLAEADQALKNGDVDGAHGLATKAKILLDELTQK